MRKSFDTLAAIMRDGKRRELASGELFLFVSRDQAGQRCIFAKCVGRADSPPVGGNSMKQLDSDSDSFNFREN